MIQHRFTRPPLGKNQIETALRAILALLESQGLVGFAYLHGSTVDFLRGDHGMLPHDVDVAVYLSEGDGRAVEIEMQTEFCRRTGLSPEIFDVHTLNNAPLTAAMGIIKHGKLLFCRDGVQHADFLERVSNRYRRMEGILAVAHA